MVAVILGPVATSEKGQLLCTILSRLYNVHIGDLYSTYMYHRLDYSIEYPDLH